MSTHHPSARPTVRAHTRPAVEPTVQAHTRPAVEPTVQAHTRPAVEPTVQRLRARAGSLRTFAARIERSVAIRLDEHAGPETWHSPRADLCRWVLGINRAQLQRSVDELRWHAHQLERQAAEIEAALAAAPVAPVAAGAATMGALTGGAGR